MSSSSSGQLKAAYEELASQITDVNGRDLWIVMMRELLREGGGPEGCLQHLETERAMMVQRIRDNLDRLNRQNPDSRFPIPDYSMALLLTETEMDSSIGFKIGWVAIEGFKGFTARQEIKLDGKHLFVLGPNGFGKSSLIEAIRWGLFGSTRRQNEVIANQTYTGPGRVEIGLDRSGQQFKLRRTLIRGASGGSRKESRTG